MTSSDSKIKEMYWLQITRRGAAPGGGGEVHFRCPVRQKLRPIQLKDPGKIKRIRGTAYPLPETMVVLFLPPACVVCVKINVITLSANQSFVHNGRRGCMSTLACSNLFIWGPPRRQSVQTKLVYLGISHKPHRISSTNQFKVVKPCW